MEKLATQQEQTGTKIQSIVSNYKKDPLDRKNLVYYQERLNRLQEAWEAFEATDSDIRQEHGDQLQHAYFVKDYYQAIKTIYERYSEEFQEKISILEKRVYQSNKTAEVETSEKENKDKVSNKSQPSHKPVKSSEEVSKVIRKQTAVIESLRRLLTRLDQDDQQVSKQAYEGKVATITRFWCQIETFHHNIWELTDDPTSHGYDSEEYFNLEERVQKTLIQLEEKLATLTPTTSQAVTLSNSMMKLPKITLPKFDGDYLKWRQFYDLFNQMVHSQPLGACQKMWYLKTHLSGEAEKLIRHLSLSDENYAAAWTMLKERYDNHRLLVTALLSKLLSQPNITTEGPAAIKTLHDTTQECLLGLENLGIDTTNWDPLLFYVLTRKLDKTTHGLYEQSLSHPKKLQPIKEFLDFLETRFQSLEALGGKTRYPERTQSAKSFTSIAKPTLQCTSCKGNHPLFACQRFLQMTPSNRLSFLRKTNLCTNCLRSGHLALKCTSRGSTKCSKKT